MNEICSSCAHKEVCRYEEEFKTKYEKIQEALKKVSCGDLIETDVKCKHYSCGAIGTIQKSPYNPLSPDWTYWPWGKDFNSSYNHCENCLNKHYLTDLTTIGDTPCTFCQYSPTRVTCVANNTSGK